MKKISVLVVVLALMFAPACAELFCTPTADTISAAAIQATQAAAVLPFVQAAQPYGSIATGLAVGLPIVNALRQKYCVEGLNVSTFLTDMASLITQANDLILQSSKKIGTTKALVVGQTSTDVIASLGDPKDVVKLPKGMIYQYTNVSVLFGPDGMVVATVNK